MQGETNPSYEDEKGRRDQDEAVVPLQSLPKSLADVLVLQEAAREGSLPIAMFLLFVDIGVAGGDVMMHTWINVEHWTVKLVTWVDYESRLKSSCDLGSQLFPGNSPTQAGPNCDSATTFSRLLAESQQH